jgi:hypothetical protein
MIKDEQNITNQAVDGLSDSLCQVTVLVIGLPLELKLVLMSAARPVRLPTASNKAWTQGSSSLPTD